MSSGLVNVPRHFRPNYQDDSFRLCMIDLDEKDPHTFNWVFTDNKDLDLEKYFNLTYEYFFKVVNNVPTSCKKMYTDGFRSEITKLRTL